MDFSTGILNLTNWVGNVILPTLSGLFLSLAVICFSKGRDYHHWMYGGLMSLMASGLLRMMETFTSQLAWENPNLYWNSLLNLTNWVANVVLPLYGALQVTLGVLHFGGIMERMHIGHSYLRNFVAAGCSFMVSGLLRLAEFFVERGTGGVS
jgi:hypothetical protein